MLTDNVRAAIIVVVGNILTAIVLFDIAELTADQVAIINSLVNGGLTLIALLIKSETPVPAPDTITITTQPPAPPSP